MKRYVYLILIAVLVSAVGVSGCVSRQKYEEVKRERDVLLEETTELEKEVVREQEDEEILETQLETMEKHMESQQEVLETELAKVEERRDQLRKRTQDLRSNLSSAREAIEELEGAEQELDRTESELSDIRERKNTLLEETEQFEEEIAQTESELEEVELQRDRLAEQRAALRKELDETQVELSNLRAMNVMNERLIAGLEKSLENREVAIEQLRDRLTLTFAGDLVFDEAEVEIKESGRNVLDQFLDSFDEMDRERYNIMIVGHTDNLPIAEEIQWKYADNWELSAERAISVAHYLMEEGDIRPSRLFPSGRSYYSPVASNNTRSGRAQNRRVEIILVPRGYMIQSMS